MGQLTLFSPINPGAQRQDLLQKIVATKIVLSVKNNNDESVDLTACGLTPDGDIQCHSPEGLPFPTSQSVCTVSFIAAGERYMLEARTFTSDNLVVLKVETFFHLQRRQNFRFKIPAGANAFLQIQEVNKKPADFKCTLTDISTEGCSALAPLSEVSLQTDDIFSGQIKVDDLKPIPVAGQLKNLRLFGEADLTVGMKFNHLQTTNEFAILEAINHLQRKAHHKKSA